MDIFPISLKLQQQRCLIVGGGHIAYRKAGLLQKAGAIIDVNRSLRNYTLTPLPSIGLVRFA